MSTLAVTRYYQGRGLKSTDAHILCLVYVHCLGTLSTLPLCNYYPSLFPDRVSCSSAGLELGYIVKGDLEPSVYQPSSAGFWAFTGQAWLSTQFKSYLAHLYGFMHSRCYINTYVLLARDEHQSKSVLLNTRHTSPLFSTQGWWDSVNQISQIPGHLESVPSAAGHELLGSSRQKLLTLFVFVFSLSPAFSGPSWLPDHLIK